MMSPTHIGSFIQTLYRERRAPESLATLAALWWWTMLTISAVLCIATAGIGAYELNSSLSPLSVSPQTAQEVATPVLNRDALNAVNTALEQRAGLYTAVQTHLPTYINPSD